MEEKGRTEKFVKRLLAKGYTADEIKRAMLKEGYKESFIAPIFSKFEARRKEVFYTKPAMIFAVLALIIILGALVFITRVADYGYDGGGFVEKANNCGSAVMLKEIDGTTFIYEAKDCILTKRIYSFSENEAAEVIALLKDKEMMCSYEKGDFNTAFIGGIIGGIESCSGPLKDAVYELRIAQYEIGG